MSNCLFEAAFEKILEDCKCAPGKKRQVMSSFNTIEHVTTEFFYIDSLQSRMLLLRISIVQSLTFVIEYWKSRFIAVSNGVT